MPDQNEKEKMFAGIMLNSKIEMPSPDIESIVMSRIYKETRSRTIRKNKRLSFICLAIEIVLGLFISFTMARFHEPIFGLSPMILTGLFQVGFFIIIFFQSEHIYSVKDE